MSTNSQTMNTPVVTRDPRFRAGRSLIQKGLASEGAIDMFSTLVEEATAKYGESSIETAPAYYEYGNALLRAAQSAAATEDDEEDNEEEDDSKPAAATSNTAVEVRLAAAAAAEQRQKQQQQQQQQQESSPNKVKHESDDNSNGDPPKNQPTTIENDGNNNSNDTDIKKEEEDPEPATISASCDTLKKEEDGGNDEKNDNEENEEEENEEEEEEGSDLALSLEMMENSFSILEEYKSTNSGTNKEEDGNNYKAWVEEQLPRILLGLGDVLSTMDRHADAADAYSRALELRQAKVLEDVGSGQKQKDEEAVGNLSQLQARRKIVEATVLIAEELLACDPDQDVITTETKTLIATAAERVEYARGYYDKARDALQETVYLMGTLAARGIDLGSEKEDVCFIATMVMGVGTQLATIDDEAAAAAAAAPIGQPPSKKHKKGV